MNTIEVKICHDCGAEHAGENNRCDMCLMEAKKLAYENGCADTITENRIKAFEI